MRRWGAVLGFISFVGLSAALYFSQPSRDSRDLSSAALAGSAFDELIDRNGGQVPYPFDSILKQLVVTKDRRFFPMLIPYGRSLQKTKTDLANPRVLVASSDYYAPIFVGYAPLAEQLEVISWNRHTSQYDFLEVKDYVEGKTPRLVASDRNVCVKCHQAEGPIFARGGSWREVRHIVDDKNFIARAIFEARKNVPFYHGINLLAYSDEIDPGLSTTHFDDQVRRANKKQQLTKAFWQICGGDIECRRMLITSAILYPQKLGLARVPFGTQTTPYEPNIDFIMSGLSEKFSAQIKGRWPAHGYAYRSSMLLDRDFALLENARPGYVFVDPTPGQQLPPAGQTYQRPTIDPKNITYDESASAMSFLIPVGDGTFWKEVPLAAKVAYLADPEYPRPLINKIVEKDAPSLLINSAAEALGFETSDYALIQKLDKNKLKEVLEGGEVTRFLQTWPIDKDVLLNAIFKMLGQPIAIKAQVRHVSNPPAPARASVSPFFRTYCMTCHDGGSFPPPLPFDSWQGLKDYRVSYNTTLTLRDYIHSKKMPPSGALQPKDDEREGILRYLAP